MQSCSSSKFRKLAQLVHIDPVYKKPVVVIEVEIEGVKVVECGQRVHVQLKAHVLEHKIQPHLLQLMIRTLGNGYRNIGRCPTI